MKTVDKPNVLLIVADDMGYGDFGIFSEGRVKTPHLDRLVSEGICLGCSKKIIHPELELDGRGTIRTNHLDKDSKRSNLCSKFAICF